MKRSILIITMLIALAGYSQDFKNISSQNEAIAQASILASKCTNSKLLNSQNFAEDNIFAVRFIPVGMTAAEYDKLDTDKQNMYLTVVFKTFDNNTFAFSRITGSYDTVFDIWKNYVSNTALKDTRNKVYKDPANKIVYQLFEDSDDRWAISRLVL